MSSPSTTSFSASQDELAQAFKALSHPARLAIVELLAEREECICGEIVDDLPLAQSTVSQHLKALKEAGLVQGTVDGPRTCYCLDTEAIAMLNKRTARFFDELYGSDSPSTCC